MARIDLEGIGHFYDEHAGGFAIEDLQLTWEDGSANALLGPSGCGKTTILNIISGLLQPRRGRVLFDGADVTRQSAKQRHIAQVFQFPVTYDAMRVFDNLAFPLRNDGLDAGAVTSRVHEIAALLGVEDVLDTPARKLTPELKQIVSLGRGIARRDTAAVLLDEPLTIVDPQIKWELRRKLRQVQHELAMTMIYVTHDQQEALTFADHVTVMKDGAIVQTGTPEDLYARPATPFVGYFIGSPGMNVIACTVHEGSVWSGGFALPLEASTCEAAADEGGAVSVGIRPEHIAVRTEAAPGWAEAALTLIEDTGAYKVLTLQWPAGTIKARVEEALPVTEGQAVWIRFPAESIRLFEATENAAPPTPAVT